MDFHEKDHNIIRSSRSQMFFKVGVLKNFAKFSGERTAALESLFNKVAGLRACNFIKKSDFCTCVFL